MKQILVEKCWGGVCSCPYIDMSIRYGFNCKLTRSELIKDYPYVLNNCPLPDAPEPLAWSDELPTKPGTYIWNKVYLRHNKLKTNHVVVLEEADIRDQSYMRKRFYTDNTKIKWLGPLPE